MLLRTLIRYFALALDHEIMLAVFSVAFACSSASPVSKLGPRRKSKAASVGLPVSSLLFDFPGAPSASTNGPS